MVYNIKKNSKTNYPTPCINCTVQCFLNEADKTDNKMVYWIIFQIPLSDCINMTEEQINDIIKTKGESLFNSPEMQAIFTAIEAGVNITTPEIL